MSPSQQYAASYDKGLPESAPACAGLTNLPESTVSEIDIKRVSRFTLLSFLLAACGIAFLAGGFSAIKTDSIVKVIGSTAPELGVALGVIVGTLGFIGLAGGRMESRKIMLVYLALMSLALIAVLVVGIWATSRLSRPETFVGAGWSNLSTDDRIYIENHYSCCGTSDWGVDTDSATCPCTSAECGGCNEQLFNSFRAIYAAFGVGFLALAVVMVNIMSVAYFIMKSLMGSAQSKGEELV